MPTDAVWIIITIPRKDYERELKKLKSINRDNLNDLGIKYSNNNNVEASLEKILSDALEELEIENVSWVPTRNGNYVQVYFPCELYENDSILNILKKKGIGTKPETSIGYIPFNLFFYEEFSDSDVETFDSNIEDSIASDKGGKKFKVKSKSKSGNVFKEATNDFLKSVTSRLTVAQVVEGVRSGAEITFDFSIYTFMAAFIAAFGLLANDPVNIAASMMIEPVMGTVMAMTFGLVIHDKKLFWLGVKNNIISLIMCIVPGYIIGLIFFIWMREWNPPPAGIWPTPQMQGRGTYEGLIYGALIALPCGGAVAVSLLNSNYGALVGVAVASTFQPPFVNSGLEFALATHLHWRGLGQTPVPYNMSGVIYYLRPAWAPQAGYSPVYSYDMRVENTLLGCVSLALTGVNVVSMLITAYIVLKMKEVMPIDKMSPGTHRFFKHDLKIAREYNTRNPDSRRGDSIGEQILNEWADIAGIDKSQLMSMSPEAREIRLRTLMDIAKDVESDETYKRIMGYTISNFQNNKPALTRRLTQPFVNEYMDKTDRTIGEPQGIWNIDQEMERGFNGRYYSPDRTETGPRVDSDVYDESPYGSYHHSGRQTHTPSYLVAERQRRRSSTLLRKSNRYSTRTPYSIWPGSQTRNVYPDDERQVRHRNVTPHPMDSHQESTGF